MLSPVSHFRDTFTNCYCNIVCEKIRNCILSNRIIPQLALKLFLAQSIWILRDGHGKSNVNRQSWHNHSIIQLV